MKPKFFFIIIIVFATLGIAQTAMASAKDHGPRLWVEPRFTEVASAVVGEPLLVWCPITQFGPVTGLGNEGWGDHQVFLDMPDCTRLALLAAGLHPTAKAKQDFATALGKLLYFANLAVGVQWSSLAVCKAAQQVELAAVQFGTGSSYARALADSFWSYGYARVSFTQSDLCRDGGPLDFNIGRWPQFPAGGKGGVG